VLHDRAENRGLQVLPLADRLGDRDEVRAKEHAAHARNAKQALGQRRARRTGFIGHVKRAIAITVRPGINFSVAGLGVASVWMNMVVSPLHQAGSRPADEYRW
jgi:hypothetical protein